MRVKDVNYYDLFIQSAQVCQKAAVNLDNMICGDDSFIEEVEIIHQIEHEGDKLYHTIYDHLNRSFITPLEREDILAIARNIEDSIDTIDEVAIMFHMLSVHVIRPEAKELAKMIVKICDTLVDATMEFKNFKKSKRLTDLLVEINHIEEDGDKLYQLTVKNLFAHEKDVLEVLKWKNIFDTMENVLDACENVADVMEGVIVKNS